MLEQITTPTLLLDEARARRNIQTMAWKARRADARFRPHFKTHQAAIVGEWFREAGVTAITVSSFDMARYFADHGWDDITVAFPINLRQINEVNALASQVKLGVLVDSIVALNSLSSALEHPVHVWVEVNAGYVRSGVDWRDDALLDELAATCLAAPMLTLAGVLSHAGNTYGARTVDAVSEIHTETVRRLTRARDQLGAVSGRTDLELSIGDTPACSMVEDLRAVDEIRPGNFVFFDWTQKVIGACQEEEIAAAVACPVVGIYPARREIVLYGGAVHLSKDSLVREDGALSFGVIAPLTEAGWGTHYQGAYLRSVSQEHGIVAVEPARWFEVTAAFGVGDLVAVLPIHSCLTANLLKRYVTLDDRVIEMAPLPR
jgi:D-serine deaminase-like pyridoxal phosphate-dependent protein